MGIVFQTSTNEIGAGGLIISWTVNLSRDYTVPSG